MLLAVGARADGQEAGPGETPTAAPPSATVFGAAPLPELHGVWSFEYRWRKTADDHDQDLFSLLGLDWGDARQRPLTAHLLLRGAADLDGTTDATGGYAFDSLADTYDQRVTGQLYQAWVGGHLDGAVADWRAGRFTLDEAPIVTTIDGGSVATRPTNGLEIEFGACGGIPVHFLESSSDGDWLVGLYSQARGWAGARTRLDWLHVEDETRFADSEDDLVGISHWQQLSRQSDLFGRLTWLEGEARDLQLRGRIDDPKGWRASVTYFELLSTQKELTTEFDPFFESAFQYEPYRQVQLAGGSEFGRHLDVAAGVDVRRLRNRDDEAAFNHEFERWYLAPTLLDLPADGTSIAFLGEVWDADRERYVTLGGDATVECGERWKVRGGTHFALYRYDLYQDRELDRVRTWFLGVDWNVARRTRLRADYEHEQDRFDRYQTLRMRLSWAF